MATPLQRLYRLKLAFLATVFIVVGLTALALDATLAKASGWEWLQSVQLSELGWMFLGAGLVAVLLHYVGKQDADAHMLDSVQKAIRSEAPAIRDAVVEGFAFAPDNLTSVASPATLDRIVENTLGLQLGDKELAHDVYHDLRQQVGSGRRYRDTHVSVSFAPWTNGLKQLGAEAPFVATIRWEYRTKIDEPLRFMGVSSADEYRDQLESPTNHALLWHFEPVAGLTAENSEAFEVSQIMVDGRQLPARRVLRAGSQEYKVDRKHLPSDEREHVVGYTFRVLVERNGHLLHLDIGKFTKGLKIDFNYGGCGIQQVKVLHYFGSAQRTRVTKVPGNSVSVSFDGWVMPKGGVAFVWMVEGELGERV
jgi:hypothetical protein